MPKLDQAEWWNIRGAQSRKAATYRCPLCGYPLHAMSAHAVIAPEGDVDRRRHAHQECVAAALKSGRMRTYDDWRKTQPKKPGVLARWLRRA